MEATGGTQDVDEKLSALLRRVHEMTAMRIGGAPADTIKAHAADLKNDIKTLAKWGTVDGRKRSRTECENRYLYPALWRSSAALSLLLATANPASAKWFSSWQDVRILFQEYLDRLHKECPQADQGRFE